MTRRFEEAVHAEDLASIERFFKIFPLIGRPPLRIPHSFQDQPDPDPSVFGLKHSYFVSHMRQSVLIFLQDMYSTS